MLAEVLVSHGREGRVATWVITAQPRSAGGDRYEIVDLIEPAAIDGLLRLTLDTSKQYTVRNLTLQAPDLVLKMSSGSAFVAEDRTRRRRRSCCAAAASSASRPQMRPSKGSCECSSASQS